MKDLIITIIIFVVVAALSWARVIIYAPPPPRMGESLETQILKAQQVYEKTGIWELKGR